MFLPLFNLAKRNILTTLQHWVRNDSMMIKLVTAFTRLERATSEQRISNAAEKNTLRNLLFNLRTQKRQMVVERLKAMSVFDDPLAE